MMLPPPAKMKYSSSCSSYMSSSPVTVFSVDESKQMLSYGPDDGSSIDAGGADNELSTEKGAGHCTAMSSSHWAVSSITSCMLSRLPIIFLVMEILIHLKIKKYRM
jgi:hypothetical protein